MKGSATSFSLPSLFCQEDESCLNELEDPDMNLHSPFSLSQSDDEYIQMLFEKETTFESNCSDQSKSLLKCARLDAIEWTLNVCSLFLFSLFYYALFFYWVVEIFYFLCRHDHFLGFTSVQLICP